MARDAVAKKSRTFVKVLDEFPDHPKVVGLSDAAFREIVTLMCRSVDDGGLVTPAKFDSLSASTKGLIADDMTIFGMVGYKKGLRGRAHIPRRVRISIFERDNWKCLTCDTDSDLTLDHIYPVALGGSDDPSNLQTLCRSCNSKKGVSV